MLSRPQVCCRGPSFSIGVCVQVLILGCLVWVGPWVFLCLGWARGASVSRGTSVLLSQGRVLSASASDGPCLLLSPGGASVSRRDP